MGNILSLAFAVLRGAMPLVGGLFTGGASWVWDALSAFVGTSLGSRIAIGLACLLGGYVWGFSHEHAAKEQAVASAIAGRDAEWSLKIASANKENEQRIKEANDAAQRVSATPVTPAGLAELCAKERAACRGKSAKGRVVPASESNVGR